MITRLTMFNHSTLLICLATIMVATSMAGKLPLDEVTKAFDDIYVKLESYNRGYTTNSGLDFNELMHVFNLYQEWPNYKKELVKKEMPLARLLIDFVIMPMRLVELQMGLSPEAISKHLRRVEDGFKRFQPAYLGELIGEQQLRIHAPKISQLYNRLVGIELHPLTLKDFKAAKTEWEGWLARQEELTSEELYTHLDELEGIWNYRNWPHYQPLFVHIFPNLKENSSIQELSKTYFDKAESDLGIRFINGMAYITY